MAISRPPKSQHILPAFIEVSKQGRPVRVPIEKVSHFMSEDKYITAYTDEGQLLLVTSLIRLKVIYGDKVALLHRKALVFCNRIVQIDKPRRDGGYAILAGGHEVPASFDGTTAYLNSIAG